jgi:hypothetical protein
VARKPVIEDAPMPPYPTEHLPTGRSTATADRPWTISTTYRRLQNLGFDEREAGDLTAYISGIAIGAVPWTVWELTHLLFLREMNRLGRCWSDAEDRAPTGVGPDHLGTDVPGRFGSSRSEAGAAHDPPSEAARDRR